MRLNFCVDGLQVGGGITEDNAEQWLQAGAEKVSSAGDPFVACSLIEARPHPQVIVTSYLFPSAKFSLDRLKALEKKLGKGKLVVDVR